jgi:hypothetical protein
VLLAPVAGTGSLGPEPLGSWFVGSVALMRTILRGSWLRGPFRPRAYHTAFDGRVKKGLRAA